MADAAWKGYRFEGEDDANKFRTFIGETHIDFMSKDKLALGMSLAVLVICLLSLLFRGLNLGLDFTGGTMIEVHYPTPVAISRSTGDTE